MKTDWTWHLDIFIFLIGQFIYRPKCLRHCEWVWGCIDRICGIDLESRPSATPAAGRHSKSVICGRKLDRMKRIHTQTNGSVALLLEELRKGSEVVRVSPIRIISIHLRCVWSSTGHQRRTTEMTCDLLQCRMIMSKWKLWCCGQVHSRHLRFASHLLPVTFLFTVRKRSLGQGNVLHRSVCSQWGGGLHRGKGGGVGQIPPRN